MLGVTHRNLIRNPAREQITAAIKAALEAVPNRSELARQIGVSRKQTYEWESGNNTTSLETLAALAEATGVPILLAFGPEQTENEPPEPEWVKRLEREIQLNRAVLRTALEGVDPDRTRRVFRLLEDQLGPPALPLGEALGESGGATPEQPTEATPRSTSI